MRTLLLLLDTTRLGLGRSLGLRHIVGFGFGSLGLSVSRGCTLRLDSRHDEGKGKERWVSGYGDEVR